MQRVGEALDPRALDRLAEFGGPELVRKLIRLFLDTSGERVDQVRAAFSGGDLEVAERGAHSLKSSAANLGAGRLQEVCAEMERLLSNRDLAGARALLDALEAAHTEVIRALEMLEGSAA